MKNKLIIIIFFIYKIIIIFLLNIKLVIYRPKSVTKSWNYFFFFYFFVSGRNWHSV